MTFCPQSPSRPSDRVAVYQPSNALYDWLRRYRAAYGEARILAALEGVTGVLYIAITVALLVARFRSEFSD